MQFIVIRIVPESIIGCGITTNSSEKRLFHLRLLKYKLYYCLNGELGAALVKTIWNLHLQIHAQRRKEHTT